ncbi:unnamed protein product [Lymnaea stagnalis]|uniref:Uncharacterized protein n=1 Tax=Lymnaea stagnalis TaxID=6523 RepID=A0AAV2HBP9_LYMST
MNVESAEDYAKYTVDQTYFEDHSAPLLCRPDGLRDCRAHLVGDFKAIGVGEVSPLNSNDLAYMLRPAPGARLQGPRSTYPGEVGWGVPWLVDWEPPKSGQQIMIGDFRQLAEDRVTHNYLGAWYPGPKQETSNQICTKETPGRSSDFRSNRPTRSSRSRTPQTEGQRDDHRSVDDDDSSVSRL